MNYFVYLIISKRKDKFISYVGYTNNIKKRLFLHNNSKGAKFTRGGSWILIYKKNYKTKKNALIEEFKLKKNSNLRKKIKEKYLNEKKN
tara:strand:- start:251 stop:517 length:267 start_codon:yes stop_codon:yes gene_type:complete